MKIIQTSVEATMAGSSRSSPAGLSLATLAPPRWTAKTGSLKMLLSTLQISPKLTDYPLPPRRRPTKEILGDYDKSWSPSDLPPKKQVTIMILEIRNKFSEKIDYWFAEGNAQFSDWIVLLGHGVTGNLSRPVIALTARELNQAGFSVLTFSFSGNGESEGDFATLLSKASKISKR